MPYETIGYFASWGIYEHAYLVRDVDRTGAAKDLTLLTYAFANVNEAGRCFYEPQSDDSDPWADYQRRFTAEEAVDGRADDYEQPLAGNFGQLRKLRARYPKLRTTISIGGWNWSRYLSNAALTEESRKGFAESCVKLFIRGDLPVLEGEPQGGEGVAAGVFDGIDIDWEWPGSEGHEHNVVRAEDKENYPLLLAELRRALDAETARTGRPYLLSVSLPASPARIKAGIAPEVFGLVDLFTVQGYDFAGDWQDVTGHQAQLFTPPDDPSAEGLSVDLAVRTYLELGAPPGKLVVGLPAHGRGWSGVRSARRGLYQPSTGFPMGTWERGWDDYKHLRDRPGRRHRDLRHGAAWIYDGDTWWSYDDVDTARLKARYVKHFGLGGAMLWVLDADDPRAPLMRTLRDELNNPRTPWGGGFGRRVWLWLMRLMSWVGSLLRGSGTTRR